MNRNDKSLSTSLLRWRLRGNRASSRLCAGPIALACVLCAPALAATAIATTACGPTEARHADSRSMAGAAGSPGSGGVAGENASGGRPSVTPGLLTPPIDEPSVTGPYRFRSVSILGGGFVTGIVFSPLERDLIFARTDIGGAYRWNVDHWMPVTDWIDRANVNSMGIESIAFDPVNPEVVYLAAGTYLTAGSGTILRSSDRGLSWSRHPIAVPMGANTDGRSMGERLAVDPSEPNTLYFASRTRGLWRSIDAGSSWSRVESFVATGILNQGLSLVSFSAPRAGSRSTLYVGVADLQGPTLYRSTDAGVSFEAVASAPMGLLPHHAAFDATGVLYFAYNDAPGPNGITRGSIWKYDPATGAWSDISPPEGSRFGGLAVDQLRPGTLIATSIDVWAPDEIYRTTNGGQTWQAIAGRATFDALGAEYLRFGGDEVSRTGWMGDVEIDPFDSNRSLYITGQGIWWSDDVGAADAGGAPHFKFENHGLEETVVLDLAVPPSGAALLSAVGDIGGFRHDDLERPPAQGMYENPVFSNTTSLDFAGQAPEVVARVGTASRGNPRGAFSTDGGATFTPFASEPLMGRGQGTIAVSADGARFVWASQSALPAFTEDGGLTWAPCLGLPLLARVSSDRVDPAVFYAVDSTGTEVFVSRDGGASFDTTVSQFPGAVGRPEAVFGNAGDLWIATGAGLFHSIDAGKSFDKLANVQTAYAVAFGKAAADETYPAIYVGGMVDYVAGVFRSDDAGLSFARVDDAQHQYGWINQLAADPNRYGRVYLGTSGRGIIYGDPVP